jgi:hypothetical protein
MKPIITFLSDGEIAQRFLHWGFLAWAILGCLSSLVAVAAGTIGPIVFLGLQLSFSLQLLFGIPLAGLLLLPTLWLGPKVAVQLYNEAHSVAPGVNADVKTAKSSA